MKNTKSAASNLSTVEAIQNSFAKLPKVNRDISIRGNNITIRGKTLELVEAACMVTNVRPRDFVMLALAYDARESAKQTVAKMDALIESVYSKAVA